MRFRAVPKKRPIARAGAEAELAGAEAELKGEGKKHGNRNQGME
jgi:hypothetical protein